MKKFRDYIIGRYGNRYWLTPSNILRPFADAKSMGEKSLEVSHEEYELLACYFSPKVSWSGKKIWGIELVIKELGL